MDILKVNNLSYTLPDKDEKILDNINFTVKKGDFILICGKSGCGKSVLLKCLNKVIPNFYFGEIQGEIIFKDRYLDDISQEYICKNIGYLWQDVDFQMINLKIEEEIAFGLENIGMDKDYITNQLEKSKKLIKLSLNSNISDLSGGQKQKVAITSLIAMNQDLILLDEPLANLDYKSTIETLEFLKELNNRGKTIIMVEHRLDVAKDYINRLIYIKNKKVNIDTKVKSKILSFDDEKYKSIDIDFNEKKYITKTNIDIIKLKNLCYKYKKSKNNIINNIDLQVKKGEKVVLLGNNGCGKTTLLKTIAGINKGRKLKYKNLDVNGKIGYVFQNPTHQIFMSTVFGEVNLNSNDESYTEEILKLFNLYHKKNNHPLSLSQGQRRLLAIASVVVSNPDILLLDEPTIGQDYESLKLITSILNDFNKKHNMTIITITHDIVCAKLLCDTVYILKNGEIIEKGSFFLIDSFFNKDKNCFLAREVY